MPLASLPQANASAASAVFGKVPDTTPCQPIQSDGAGRPIYTQTRQQPRRQAKLYLTGSLANEQFAIVYRPMISLSKRDASGFEAVLRWRHPERGLVSPDQCIPVIRDIGAIVPVDEWLIRQITEEAMTWPDNYRLLLSLSRVQLRRPYLARTIREALAEAGIDASRMDVQIKRSALVQPDSVALTTLHALSGLGVRIILDKVEHGPLFSSCLEDFPFDGIKIAASLVDGLPGNATALRNISFVLGRCFSLGLTATADGVQTPSQVALLRAEGCTDLQGPLFGAPQAAMNVPSMIAGMAKRVPSCCPAGPVAPSAAARAPIQPQRPGRSKLSWLKPGRI